MAEDKISPLSLLPSAGTWSLTEDASLLSAMQELSFTISSQAKQLLDKMDQLAISTASAQTRLQTTTNNFMLLSNIKFIEARVYEDSEVETPIEEINLATKNEETINEDVSTTEALKNGLDVIETAFEKVEIHDSDSDSDVDEEKMISVLQPKNPYHVRSLPAVIGTQSWIDDDKIGLVEEEVEEECETSGSESEEEEILKDKKEDSEYSESDTEKVEEPKKQLVTVHNVVESDSVSDFSDDDELFKPKAATNVNQSNLTVPEDQSELEGLEANKVIKTQNNDVNAHGSGFANELSSKLGLEISKSKDDTDQENVDTSDDEVEQKSKPKKSVKLPPKKSVLFDSSDSDDDLFAPKPKATPPKVEVIKKTSDNSKDLEINKPKSLPPLPPPAKSKPLKIETEDEKPERSALTTVSKSVVSDVESHSDDDFFAAISSKPAVLPASTKIKEVVEKPLGKSLFGDSSDEDDIFSDIKIGSFKPEANPVSKVPTAKTSLFDESDDSDDLFADLISKTKNPISENKNDEILQTQTSKKPFGGISMFGNSAPPLFTAKSDNEDKDILDVNFKENAPTVEKEIKSEETDVKQETPPPVPAVGSKPMPQKQKSLLDEADENIDPTSDLQDEEEIVPETKTFPPIPPTSSKPKHKEAIGKYSSQNLPDKEESEIDMKNPVDEINQILPPIPPSSMKPNQKEAIKTELSEKVPEEDAAETKLKKPVGGVSMFGGFDPRKLMKNTQIGQDDKDGGHATTVDTANTKEHTQHTDTLVTLTKSRPKMKGGRKPPTRAGRKNAIESSNAFSFDVIDGPVTTETVSMANQVITDNSEQKQPKAPLGGLSMLGGLNPAQLMKPKNNISIENTENPKEISSTNDSVENNNGAFAGSTSATNKDNEIASVSLAQPASPAQLASPAQPASSAQLASPALSASPVSDFDGESTPFEPPPMTDMNEKLDKKNNLFGFDDTDSDDDMFSNIATSSNASAKTDPIANIFGDDSDDDLFSSLTSKR